MRAELGQFNLGLYPQSRWTPEELDLRARRILRALPEWTAQRFLAACIAHELRSKLPPGPSDLLAAEKAARETAPYHGELPALPAWDTDAKGQAARNIAGCKRILEEVCRGKRV